MARRDRVRLFDPSDDPELVASALDLGRLGEVAFLRGVAAAADVLVPNPPMPIEEWAAGNVFIPASKTTRGGRARLSGIQRGVCRLLQSFGTDSVVLLKGPRIGASTLTAILMLYYGCHEQSDVLLYERSVPTAQTFSKDKLMPILRASTDLKVHLRPDGKTGEQDTWDNRELLNGASIKCRSIANDDSFKGLRGRFIAGEEAGDAGWQPGPNSKEGSKIERLRRRGQEFGDGKVYRSGTPTLKGQCLISAEYDQTDRCVYAMPCPHCGHVQPFEPDVRRCLDPAVRHGPGIRYLLDGRGRCTDAWYECANADCTSPGGRIEEHRKSAMMDAGEFVPTTVGEPGRRGAYVWLAHSEDEKATWRHIGQDHDRQMIRGGEEEKKEFTNLVLGLAFSPTPTAALDPSSLEARAEEWTRDDGSPADAPAWAEALFAGIDCQRGSLDDATKPPRLEVTVHAVGRNRRRAVVAHRVISHREVVDRFTGEIERVPVEPFTAACSEAVWELLERDWMTEDGRALRVRRTMVDNAWRPDDAQRFCFLPRSRDAGIVPIRGSGMDRGSSRASLLPDDLTLARSKKSGRQYLYVGTQAAKDTLGRILSIPAPGPESLVFAADLPRSYYEGLLAERLVEVKPGVRRWDPVSADNTGEPLDCLVYSYAAERYEMRKSPRLRKLVDAIDPAAAAAALAAQAAAQAPDVPDPETVPGSDAPAVRTAEDPGEPALQTRSGLRFRVVDRSAARPAVSAEQEAETRRAARQARIQRRPGRKGIGW